MGRKAIAFLVLVAVGGCVQDDQDAALAPRQGQPLIGAAPAYATWTRPNAVVAPPAGADPAPPRAAAPAVVSVPAATTTALKPTAVRIPAAAPAAPAAAAAAPPAVDADLVAATMVQAPGNAEPATHEITLASNPPGPNAGGEATAKTVPASARMINSKRITLNYELKDVGALGVAGVELWCTQDTRTWQRGEIIAQTNHSFTVEVKDEGLYGFTLLARNGSGAGKEPPKPGDQPQVWVSVDVTKPAVQITALEMTHAGKAPTLTIRWTAKHKDLAPQPISLAYSQEPEGPWTPIAAGLDNSGEYEWQPTGALPPHLYVRVEAADRHGNVGAAQTANPLRIDAAAAVAQANAPTAHKPLPAPPALDASRPTAAILDVVPCGN